MNKRILMEAIKLQKEDDKERINPDLMRILKDRKTSLGNHPAFPIGDETDYEEKIMQSRFEELLKNYKRQYDVDKVLISDAMLNSRNHLVTSMELEQGHEDELIDIAIKMVREEFDVAEDEIEFECHLNAPIDDTEINNNMAPTDADVEFENHAEMVKANKEVYKRRFINAMIQGSAKKCSHMFHLVEKEISDINPRLNANYSKLMAAADYMYMVTPDAVALGVEGAKTTGGIVNVEYPQSEGEPVRVIVKAFTFPILVHELVKGVMEVLSTHGLPEEDHIAEFVMAKADFTAAEPWDMRLGPKLWEAFLESIDVDDYEIKHHIFAELISLPAENFHHVMRELLGNTKESKKIMTQMSKEVRERIETDSFNVSLLDDDFMDDEFFEPGELNKFDPSYFDEEDEDDDEV